MYVFRILWLKMVHSNEKKKLTEKNGDQYVCMLAQWAILFINLSCLKTLGTFSSIAVWYCEEYLRRKITVINEERIRLINERL